MNFFTLRVFLVILVLQSFCVVGQSAGELKAGYYVVVAAYASTREDYANRYTQQLTASGHTAQYGFNTKKNLYFVYLSYFTDLKSALVDMQQVRSKGQFTDAWVRVVSGDIVLAEKPATDETAPKTENKPIESTPAPQPIPPVEEKPVTTLPADEPEEEQKLVQYPVMTLGNTEVFLSLYNATNNRVIDGDVQVIDTERNRLITTVKGNEYLILPDPKTKSGQLTLIAEVFGYRKQQVEINYPLPLRDTIKPYIELMGTTLAVKFDMTRYHRGDIATLYHVYFFNDAAIMLPESKYELTSLVELMKENPNYRIKLHGHTNGNYHGKILQLGPDQNFFSLDGARQTIGSAKDLSFQRAETIKEYLMVNGIDGSRIEIKAWGGKRPLYDRHSANAKKNVRVEVEILQE
ncbi:MAG: OmpA family protein [Cyclobacteriaceae bacterium]|nr:OmpA family protein [Cyclobacteriaceae bacterium]